MTDEEIRIALGDIKLELQALYADLEIEGPVVQMQQRKGPSGGKGHGGRTNRNFVPGGDGIPDEDCDLDDDVLEDGDTV